MSPGWDGNTVKVYPTSAAFTEMAGLGTKLAGTTKDLTASSCQSDPSAAAYAKVLDQCYAQGGNL